MTTADAERIARRYPAPRTPRWLWRVLAGALALVGATWLLWSATYGASPAVDAHVVSFQVTSDQTVEALITVQRPDPSVRAVCTLVAQAVTYDTVGQLPVELAPGTAELEQHRVVVRTFKRATTVTVQSCRKAP